MKFLWPTAPSHLLVMVGLSSMVVFINASGFERPLRVLDRDLHTSMRGDFPDLLRSLDLRPPLKMPIFNLSVMNLAGEDMRGLRMANNRLHELDLRGSHVEEAHFQCVSMDRVNLSGADLKDSRFDYANCGTDNDSAPTKYYTLTVNLNGADLSSAILEGKQRTEGELKGECQRILRIVGNLNGAQFKGATLRCVTLVNLAKKKINPSEQSAPRYAGINFVNSKASTLTLEQGSFRFSDFFSANLELLQFNPDEADLRFSTLAQLQCTNPSKGCQIMQTKQGNPSTVEQIGSPPKLSLNLRGSRVTSNLPLPASRGWPALLCNRESAWRTPTPANSQPSNTNMGLWVQKPNTIECAESELMQGQQNAP